MGPYVSEEQLASRACIIAREVASATGGFAANFLGAASFYGTGVPHESCERPLFLPRIADKIL